MTIPNYVVIPIYTVNNIKNNDNGFNNVTVAHDIIENNMTDTNIKLNADNSCVLTSNLNLTNTKIINIKES